MYNNTVAGGACYAFYWVGFRDTSGGTRAKRITGGGRVNEVRGVLPMRMKQSNCEPLIKDSRGWDSCKGEPGVKEGQEVIMGDKKEDHRGEKKTMITKPHPHTTGRVLVGEGKRTNRTGNEEARVEPQKRELKGIKLGGSQVGRGTFRGG